MLTLRLTSLSAVIFTDNSVKRTDQPVNIF